MKHEMKADKLAQVTAIVQQVQSGTRVLQTACVEAKARKLGSVTRLVPKVKKSLEQFVQSMKVLIAESTSSGSVWVGNLKHKNLQGEVVPQEIESEPEEAHWEEEAQADGEGSEGGQDDEATQ
jgi:fanconi anemia group D2 protein